MTTATSRKESPVRVLVLEDDPEMSAVVGESLQREGCEVTTFSHGSAALASLYQALFRGAPLPDLIIADERVPGLGGVEVLRRLRKAGCRVPAVIMSGFASDELRERAREAGVVAVFDKPFDLGALRAFVAKHVRDTGGK